MKNSKSLVIVESPAKAATLSRFLGDKYNIKASKGHIRDLPKSTMGVDIEKNFTPTYKVPPEKKKVIKEIKDASEKAVAIYLATDPDREGEAISWHLVEAAGLNKDGHPIHRVVFHEIVAEAVQEAFKHPRKINMDLVNAQQARRILDRIVGYQLSPWLWMKVKGGLSAGRVQSAALRLVVEREKEILGFLPQEYWSIEAELSRLKEAEAKFRAALVGLKGEKKLDIDNKEKADSIAAELKGAKYSVLSVATKEAQRQPPPPFITSTLQQEAWRKFRFSAERTMSLAQQLYEGLPIGKEGPVGLITYMRTDSIRVSHTAINEARDYIAKKYQKSYLPPHARLFSGKKVKGAQEAHEAIRPTSILREPQHVKSYLDASQFKIYDLIWKRMLASQMAASKYHNTSVDISATIGNDSREYILRASSSVQTFPGFTILYTEGKDDAPEEAPSFMLPHLKKGEILKLLGLYPEQHFTQPPPRYTEATLIKTLEEKGIGRPSTYAPIISTLLYREYVLKTEGRFFPQEVGMKVSDLLTEHFKRIVDLDFTAQMEEELDKVASGSQDWITLLKEFYKDFSPTLQEAMGQCSLCGKPMIAKRSRFGMFLACSGYPECKNIMKPMEEDAGTEPEKTDEICSLCGKPMVVKSGRFGKFLACSGYPECKNTKPFIIKTGTTCPECGGSLLGRMSKKGRLFYGCSNYPKCKFISRYKPITQPCPFCQGLLVQTGADRVKCTRCKKRSRAEDLEMKELKEEAVV